VPPPVFFLKTTLFYPCLLIGIFRQARILLKSLWDPRTGRVFFFPCRFRPALGVFQEFKSRQFADQFRQLMFPLLYSASKVPLLESLSGVKLVYQRLY